MGCLQPDNPHNPEQEVAGTTVDMADHLNIDKMSVLLFNQRWLK